MRYTFFSLTNRPEWKDYMATWFHQKWGIPLEAYQDSMNECLEGKGHFVEWLSEIKSYLNHWDLLIEKKNHNLKFENHVLFGGLSEDFKPRRQLLE